MRNIFINNYRRFGRTVPIVDSTDAMFSVNIPPESEIENPEGTYGAAEIMQTINSFSDQYRLPFAMHIAGYKYDEISKYLDMPLGTVKSRIYIARKKLQKQFKDYR
jgi:RNA polymerase sigma-70 factor (ECF subfamily)